MAITVVHNAAQVAASLNARAARADQIETRIMGRAAQLAVTKIKARTPVDEGTLQRSINARQAGPGVWSIGTNIVYARRIEFGFMNMTDSLGRTFRQPPQPYMLPGMQDALPEIRALVTAEVRRLVR